MAWAVRWPRKHRYRCTGQRCYDYGTTGVYRCAACGNVKEMDRYQARQMLWWQARCSKGREVSFSEALQLWLSSEYAMFDCYESVASIVEVQ